MDEKQILKRAWEEYEYVKRLTSTHDFDNVREILIKDGYLDMTLEENKGKDDCCRVDTEMLMFEIRKDRYGDAQIIDDDIYMYYEGRAIFEGIAEEDFRELVK